MVRRNIKIGAIALAAVEFLYAASLQAVPIPGSSAVVDPFNFDFTGAGIGSYQITENGVPVSNLTGYSAGSGSGVGEMTYCLPNVTESGDVAVIDPRIKLNSLLLASGGMKYNGVYLIPVAWADSHLDDFVAGMQFTPDGQANSYLQFYFHQKGLGIAGTFAKPVLFSSQEYLLAIPGTEGANGSLSFSFHTGALAGNPYDNNFSGSAQGMFATPLGAITAVPEPTSRVVFFGLFGMVMVATAVKGWRKRFAYMAV